MDDSKRNTTLNVPNEITKLMRDELLHMRGIFTITCMAVSAVNRLTDMLTHSCPSFGFGMTGGVVSPKS